MRIASHIKSFEEAAFLGGSRKGSFSVCDSKFESENEDPSASSDSKASCSISLLNVMVL
jgi:hypothetical protein